ncbi:VC1465 family Xer recombination activation factor, partial [Polaromonas sp.]|uniref:VC1465 family Xer recombination activation factor n=1 Tax=Polaromonas sp. TaxID=1869339 RepID=UPI003750F9E6
RAALFDLGLTHPEAAKLLHVSLRTLQNWLSGRHEVPYASFKLLKLMRYMELPGESWRGWSFSRGMLVTPEGRTISGNDGSWWTLLVRQARCFSSMYRKSGQLERALIELTALSGQTVQASVPSISEAGRAGAPVLGGDRRAHRAPVGLTDQTGLGRAAAQPPALIYLKNTTRHKQSDHGLSTSGATETIAPNFTSWKVTNYG